MRKYLVLFLMILAAGPALAQFYSYRGPDGKLHITDRPIKRDGYKLQKKYIPPSLRDAQRKADEEKRRLAQLGKKTKRNKKYQLSQAQIAGLVEPIARAYGVDPDLVKAVIEIESGRNYRIVSSKGAQGLMQLIPETADRFGVKNAFDPRQNIKGGIKYLRFLLAYFEGNVNLALAAYNAGENAVDRHGGVPPYRETRRYLQKIRKLYSTETVAFDKRVKHRSKLLKKEKAEPQVARAD